MDDVRQTFGRMCMIQEKAEKLLDAIDDLRALFPNGELPHYLQHVEHAIEEVEPTLKDIIKARPY